MLLIAKDCLDWECYGLYEDDSLWNKSYLREYLEEKFEEYFSDEEKYAIIEKEFGKLFVLSENEMLKYCPIAEDRRAVMHSRCFGI